jgi:hypothetical protein
MVIYDTIYKYLPITDKKLSIYFHSHEFTNDEENPVVPLVQN